MSKFNTGDLAAVEAFLANNQYLSGGDKPNHEDATIFEFLFKNKPQQPCANKQPNIFAWFQWINMFSDSARASWGACTKAPVGMTANAAKGGKKEEKKPAAEEDELDLFGEDDEEAEKANEERLKRIAQEKGKNKPKVAGRTTVIFDVKVFEIDQDLNALAKRIISEVKMEGLKWGEEWKLAEVAYGVKKLQIGCIIQDDLVSTDDIIDQIQGWEDDVQSVDIATMQKV